MRLRCPELIPFLKNEGTVITPNRLLADVAATQFAAAQIASGKQSWQRPRIVSLYPWLVSLWQDARYAGIDVPNLLSPAQERTLWQQLFEEHHPELFNSDAAAGMAIDASRTLAEWHIPLDGPGWEDAKDAAHFRTLYRKFTQLCRERDSIARSHLWPLAAAWLRDQVSTSTFFAGFTSISPALRLVLNTLGNQASVAAMSSSAKGPSAAAAAVRCEHQAAEFEFAARRVRHLFESKPRSSIGVLVANLRERRVAVSRAFEAVFYPRRSSIGPTSSDQRAYHIGSGQALLHHPLVQSALLILEAASGSLLLEDASALLRSPYLKEAAQERNERALIDAYIRRNRNLRITLNDLLRHSVRCPGLLSVWREVQAAGKPRHERLTLSAWSEWISKLLSDVGWPSGILTSTEMTVADLWRDALTQLASLTYVSATLSFGDAIRDLRRLLLQTETPGSGDWYSPVQILDADAAADISFDSVVCIGFSEGLWPLAERGQPFIPLALRRAAGVPGSAVSEIKAQRETRIQRILSAAPDVVVTFIESLTPLAKRYVSPTNSDEISHWTGRLPLDSFHVEVLDRIEDDYGPPLQATLPVRGGVSIIKSQSQCPFQAFGRFRLLADSLEEPSFGIDARDRGGFLHQSLENAWRKLGDSQTLQDTSINGLRTLIRDAVAEAVAETSDPFQEVMLSTERDRLEALLFEWLQLEKLRKVPFSVEFLEEARQIELAGLLLSLRVDRVDRLSDGKMLLIDYKSSALMRPGDLLGDRPKEPQLMVYAAAVGSEVEGVYLAQVKAREMKVHGIAAREHFPDQKRSKDAPSWTQERLRSQTALPALAAEFMRGYAAVDPKHPDQCRFCSCKLICRIAESGSDPSESSDE